MRITFIIVGDFLCKTTTFKPAVPKTTVLVEGERLKFNKDATRWLGIRLDSQLKFTAYINEKMSREFRLQRFIL